MEQLPSEPRARTRPRSWFWPAFVSGFILLSVASCGGLAALVGLNELSLSDLRSSAPVWTPPPLPATAEPGVADGGAEGADTGPENPGDGRFEPGMQARNATNSRVNIRRQPGYLSAPADDILAQMQPGDRVTILGWPQAADNLLWWPIRYDGPDGPVEGWVAESTASGVGILVPTP